MRSHRTHLGGGYSGEPPCPILRVIDVSGGTPEGGREALFLPKDLRTKIEAPWQTRRHRFIEARANGVVFIRKLIRTGELVIHDRQRQAIPASTVGEECSCRP